MQYERASTQAGGRDNHGRSLAELGAAILPDHKNDTPPYRPGRCSGRIGGEMLVGISAVVIGLCALGVSLYEAALMREEQRSAVLPLLEISRSYYTDGLDSDRWRLLINVSNVGIGPARVRDFEVRVDGRPYSNWAAALQALTGIGGEISYGHSTINGRTVPPDTDVVVFDLNDTEHAQRIGDAFGRLELVACYCSVFDECWIATYAQLGVNTPVESCSRTDDSFVE